MMHFFLFCLFLLTFLCVVATNGATFTVRTADELVDLFYGSSATVSDEILLANDLDFSHINLVFPLGGSASSCSPFGGVLDGGGYSIKNLIMMSVEYPNSGLFCGLKNARIENLVIDESCSFIGDVACALSPAVTGQVSMRNVTNKARVIGKIYAGGFIGNVSGSGQFSLTFDSCVNSGNITGHSSYAGGFIGGIYGSQVLELNISNSVNNGIVNGTASLGGFVGGIVGGNESGMEYTITVVNTTNEGNVTNSEGSVGGFIGTINSLSNVTVAFSESVNMGWVDGSFVGGFIGSIKYSNGIVVNISDCKNDAYLTGSSFGGLIGVNSRNENEVIVITKVENQGVMKAESNGGGLIGDIFLNTRINLLFSECTNKANLSGRNNLGGFLGSIADNIGISVDISFSTSGGIVAGNSDVGGFVGLLNNNKNMTFGFNHCKSNCSITGNTSIAGFIGNIYSSRLNSLALEITNCISDGTISAPRWIACGMFCIGSDYNDNVTTTVYNSLVKGRINPGSNCTAYGITNNVTSARNVVNMVDIKGSSNYSQFWAESIDTDSLYGLVGNCEQCGTNVKLFEKSESNGMFLVSGSGERVDVMLNNKTMDGDAKWTYDLSLTTKYLNVIARKPVNGEITIDGLNPLDHLLDLCELFMGECTIVDYQTKQPIRSSSSIKNGTTISFCYNVTVSGVVVGTSFVELNTQMKDIQLLSPFFNEQYGVTSVEGETKVVYTPSYIVNKNMVILVVQKYHVAFGNPFNRSVYVFGGEEFGQIAKQNGIKLDGFIFRVKETQTILSVFSVIESDIHLELCHNVSISGVFTGSFVVEHETILGNIKQLQLFLSNDFSFVSSSNKNQVFTNMTSVYRDMAVTIIKNTHVVVEIDPTDDVNTTDIINAITGIISVDPGYIIVDVVRNDDGQVTEITIIVIDEETAITIVDTINSIETGDGCDVGVLCRRKRAYMEVETLSLSGAHLSFVSLFAFLLIFFVYSLF